jgi:hypothetical protein
MTLRFGYWMAAWSMIRLQVSGQSCIKPFMVLLPHSFPAAPFSGTFRERN